MGDVKQGNFGGKTSSSSSAGSAKASESSSAAVLDLGAFRTKKSLSADRKTSVSEAFSGMTSRTPANESDSSSEMELADRIERIKGSIQRINQLMTELKGTSLDATPRK